MKRKKAVKIFYYCLMKKTEKFCRSLLGTKIGKVKAMCNLIFALSSNMSACSVTALSGSDYYFYQYSSISDAIHGLYSRYFADALVMMSAKAAILVLGFQLYILV